MLSGAISGFGAGFGLWMGIAWGAMAGAGGSALMGGNPAIGAGIGAFSAALGYGAMRLAKGNILGQIVGSAAVGAVSGGISSEAYGGEFGEGAGYGAGYAAAGAVASAGVKYASNGFKTDAEVQATQRKIANLQAMLDEVYAEGGTVKQVKISVEILSVTTSAGQNITPSAWNVLNKPMQTLGGMSIKLLGDLNKASFPYARATAKISGSVLGGITLGTDIAQFYVSKPWYMRIHDGALVAADLIAYGAYVPHPAFKALRWVGTLAHTVDEYTNQ